MRLLIIDDEHLLRNRVAKYFQSKGHDVRRASDGRSGLALIKAQAPHVVLLDLRLPDLSGLEVLQIIKQERPATGVVMLTGHGDVQVAVEALQTGADHFLLKPMNLDALESVVEQIGSKYVQQSSMNRYPPLRVRSSPERNEPRYILPSPIVEQIHVLARSPSTPVLIQGETGTGKGLVASLIHELGQRKDHPFVDLNCAGLGATLLESDLFGHERGAFTDAKTMKRGLFEVAAGGTVFLDEIGDMPMDVQAKLLKFVEERRFRRLGSTSAIAVDVRVISATNLDLSKAVQTGKFRSDLYYRLNVMPLVLPPLRKRSLDIPPLVSLFVRNLSRALGKPATACSPEALGLLQRYSWPGNIRELRNVLERAVLLCSHETIQPAHLPDNIRGGTGTKHCADPDTHERLEVVEMRHIERVLAACHGNRSHTADALGIHRVTLLNKLKKYGIEA